MAGTRTNVAYVSDDGNTYQLKMDASNATAVGAGAAAGTEPFVPPRTRPRYVLAQHPDTGNQRRIMCPDPTEALWTAIGGTLALIDTSVHPSVSTTYNLRGRVGERRYA
jgi:hypothetical protein